MQSFTTDGIFNGSHFMASVNVSWERMHSKFGKASDYTCDKSEATWEGNFKANDGTIHRASMYDYQGCLMGCGSIHLWIDDERYLNEFISFVGA